MTINELLDWAKSKELSIIQHDVRYTLKYKDVIFLKIACRYSNDENLVFNYRLLGGYDLGDDVHIPMCSYKAYAESLEKTTLNHLNYSLEDFIHKYDFLLLYNKKQAIIKRKMEMCKDFNKS